MSSEETDVGGNQIKLREFGTGEAHNRTGTASCQNFSIECKKSAPAFLEILIKIKLSRYVDMIILLVISWIELDWTLKTTI